MPHYLLLSMLIALHLLQIYAVHLTVTVNVCGELARITYITIMYNSACMPFFHWKRRLIFSGNVIKDH